MKFIKITILLLVAVNFATAQEQPEVKNIDLDVENNKVIVNYDLLSTPQQKHKVGLYFLDESFNVVKPYTLSGDYGDNVTPGRKKIVWDIAQDKTELSRQLRAKIVLHNTQTRLGGPQNLFLSLLVPGLGDYFVKNPDDMVIKPYMRTIATLGLVGLGFKAAREREEVPLTSIKQSRYFNRSTWEWETNLTEIVYGYEKQYWLFKNDAEILLAAGAAMWIADIIWVAAEGRANSKISHIYSNMDVQMNRFGGMNFAYTVKF
jgi:hypothetical protein